MVGRYGGTLRWDPRLRRRAKHFAIFTGKPLCWSLFLINKSVFNKHWCFPVNIAKFLRVAFSFRLLDLSGHRPPVPIFISRMNVHSSRNLVSVTFKRIYKS